MTDDPGRVLHRLILAADPGWQDQFARYGEKALGHQALSQLLLLVDDVEPVFIDAKVEAGPEVSFVLRIFTSESLIVTTTDPEAGVISEVIPRHSLHRIQVLSAPVVTIGNLNHDDRHFQLRLRYMDQPAFEFPMRQSWGDRAEAARQLVPSLQADLQAQT